MNALIVVVRDCFRGCLVVLSGLPREEKPATRFYQATVL